MQVVIADDEPITRMDLKEILEKEGHQVVAEAADGFDAIECCRDCHPDLVVMDVKMPLLDGITASKVIAEEDLAETVVLLTAYCDREFIEEAKEAKVSGYFVKPVEERTVPAGAGDRSGQKPRDEKASKRMPGYDQETGKPGGGGTGQGADHEQTGNDRAGGL